MLKLGEKLERYHTAVQVGGALTGGSGTCQVCVEGVGVGVGGWAAHLPTLVSQRLCSPFPEV